MLTLGQQWPVWRVCALKCKLKKLGVLGVVPSRFGKGLLIPLLNKPTLDPSISKHYIFNFIKIVIIIYA